MHASKEDDGMEDLEGNNPDDTYGDDSHQGGGGDDTFGGYDDGGAADDMGFEGDEGGAGPSEIGKGRHRHFYPAPLHSTQCSSYVLLAFFFTSIIFASFLFVLPLLLTKGGEKNRY